MKKNLRKKNKKGFTLIELVVVIAILGILAAILVPVISGFIETANQSSDNANARLVYQAAAMWYATTNPTAASTTLAFSDIQTYIGGTGFPAIRSTKYTTGTTAGWVVTVTSSGTVAVSYNGHVYNVATAKLS
jgi:prepilin-type N-terminal cleavage/methylation domain-containing protein